MQAKHNVECVAMLDLDNKYDETLAFVKSVYDKLPDGPDAPLQGNNCSYRNGMNIMAAEKVTVARSMI